MQEALSEADWDTLLWRIKDKRCTPFLGAGACCPTLPLGKDIAKKWAKEDSYPLSDCDDLARVAQFLAVNRKDPMFPKEKIVRLFKDIPSPDFDAPDEPHSVLADLPLPIFITTNYDDFMIKALKSRNKDPKLELCRWNKYVKDQPSIFKSRGGFDPTPEKPVVFHLHGYMGVPESVVLTEDDYLDFLVNISRDRSLLPARIERAISASSLLFIGYRLADWSFRVLFRGLVGSLDKTLRRINVAVQLQEEDKAQDYLTKYFKNTDVLVYWGTARNFVADLRTRWERFNVQMEGSKNGA